MLTPADWHEIVDVTLAVLISEVIWMLLVHGGEHLWKQWRKPPDV